MIIAKLLSLQPADLDQCPQSQIFGLFHLFQSIFHDDPVFIQKIHHITDRRHCCKFQQLRKTILSISHGNKLLLFRLFQKHLYQFIGNDCPTDPLIRIMAVLLLWIDDKRGRQDLFPLCHAIHSCYFPVRHFMMVCDKHLHAKLLCQCDLLCRCNPIITGDDHFYLLPAALPDDLFVQSVPILDPVRDPVTDQRP